MTNLLSICILLLLTACNKGGMRENQSTTSFPDAERIKRIETSLYPVYNIKGKETPKTIPQMMKERNISGISIAFVDKGKVAWTKTYGYANLEDSVKITPNTVFRAASLSKPLTAMAALHLVEVGVLELDQDVNQELKGWKLPENEFTKEKKVTVRNLIAHNSGLDNGIHTGLSPEEEMPANEEILSGKVFNTPAKVISVPGEKNKYSNIGYMVLSELLTDVTGKEFHEFMDEIILQPSGMESSTFDQNIPEKFKNRIATGYDEHQQPIDFYHHPSQGAGALWTTPSDLGRFLITILEDYNGSGEASIISKSMAEHVFNTEGEKLGFNNYTWDDNIIFRNDGSIPGYNCFLMGSLYDKQALVVMLNNNSDEANDFLNYVWRAVAMEYDWGMFEPAFYESVEVPNKELESYTGTYAGEGDSISFLLKNDKLFIDSEKTGVEELTAIGNSSFLLPSIPHKYIFGSDSLHNIINVEMRNERDDFESAYKKAL